MINETKIAIQYLTELRDSRQKVLPNEAPYYEAEKDMDIFNLAIKALERPQGELAEKLKDRIEEGVCKYCQMNKHCEICEISRVFQIITLMAEEQS